jgi:hypothetical protein
MRAQPDPEQAAYQTTYTIRNRNEAETLRTRTMAKRKLCHDAILTARKRRVNTRKHVLGFPRDRVASVRAETCGANVVQVRNGRTAAVM